MRVLYCRPGVSAQYFPLIKADIVPKDGEYPGRICTDLAPVGLFSNSVLPDWYCEKKSDFDH